jgi:hypothetical protein
MNEKSSNSTKLRRWWWFIDIDSQSCCSFLLLSGYKQIIQVLDFLLIRHLGIPSSFTSMNGARIPIFINVGNLS